MKEEKMKKETTVAVEGHPSASTPASLSAANGQAKMKEKRMKKETIEAVGGHPNALTPASSSASDWRPGQPGQLDVRWEKQKKVAPGKEITWDTDITELFRTEEHLYERYRRDTKWQQKGHHQQ